MQTNLTLASLATLLLSGGVYAQTPRQAVLAAEASFVEQVSTNGMKTAFLANASPTAMVVENGKLLAAQAVWESRPATANTRLTWYPLLADLAQTGDLGYVIGTYRHSSDAKHPQESGSYLRIWRREAVAGWRLALEMLNSPAPAAAPAAGAAPAPVAEGPGTVPAAAPGRRAQ